MEQRSGAGRSPITRTDALVFCWDFTVKLKNISDFLNNENCFDLGIEIKAVPLRCRLTET
jgi:hypothetical protein